MSTNIVGIGASAGGLEALTELLEYMPTDTGLAFVVVQHMAPAYPPMLPELLASHSGMPVRAIESGQRPAANTVYVIPPGFDLSIRDGVLSLVGTENDGRVHKPIDQFFNALASDQGDRAYALVLSGTGSDGSRGITAIKAAGGIVMAQRSDSARFAGMPDSAVATGLVDFVLAPRDMPQKLVELVRLRNGKSKAMEGALQSSIEAALPEILADLGDFGASTFHHYKKGTLIRRILRRMILKHFKDVETYRASLRNSEEERTALMQDFLIGVTHFFRNPEAFAFIRNAVLPELFDRDQDEFRIWVPGCSTGEETFSLAMLVRELQTERDDARPWKLFGTDMDPDSLAAARRAVYPEETLAHMTPERRKRFFTQDEGVTMVSSDLRDMCVFAAHNVLVDPPFSNMDLISCRNLMIYIEQEAQEGILTRFHYALKPKSFLWLGPSESLPGNTRLFGLVDRNSRVYRRRTADLPTKPPYLNFTSGTGHPRFPPTQPMNQISRKNETKSDIESATEQAFLSSFAAPFARISQYDEVIYASEAMRPLLRPSKGVPSVAVDDYFVESLRMPVRLALRAAREDRKTAEITDVVVVVEGVPQIFDIRARPLEGEADSVLVALQPVRLRGGEDGPKSSWNDRQESYEIELALARKRLAARERDFEMAEQELRAGNEELLTMNEELQSTNEELETSREELHSVNEELETINSELLENNRQLNESSSNIKNLLESTDIAVLFVNHAASLRLFTPRAQELFAVQERDIGRSIFDLSTNLDYPDLKLDLDRAMERLETVSREVATTDGRRNFLVRVRPYRDTHGRSDGAVASFIEITEQLAQERRQREISVQLAKQVAEMESFTELAPIGIGLHGRDMRYLRVNQYLADTVGLKAADMIGRHPEDVVPEIWHEVHHMFEEILATGTPKLNVEVTAAAPGSAGHLRTWIANYFPIRLETEETFGIGVTALEVTEFKRLELSLAAKHREIANEGLRILSHFEEAPMQVVILEGDEHVIVHANRCAREAFGEPDPTGKTIGDISRALHDSSKLVFDEVYRSGRMHIDDEIEIPTINETGAISPRMFRRIVQPYAGADGMVTGLLLLALDITQIVRMREAQLNEKLRLEAVIASLETQVALLDRDGRIVELNHEVAETNGEPEEALQGSRLWDLDAFRRTPGGADRLRSAFDAALEGRSSHYDDCIGHAGDDRQRRVTFTVSPLRDAAGRVDEVVVSIVDQTELLEANAFKDIVVAELEHRVKNVIATMQAVVQFTAMTSKDPNVFVSELNDRLDAMARTHEQLTTSGWTDQSLHRLIQKAASAYLGDRAEVLEAIGDDITLSPGKAMVMGMAFHELITNAFKHGALSLPSGKILIETRSSKDGTNRFVWKELCGEPPKEESAAGFGTLLLTKILPSELGAKVTRQISNVGLLYELEWRS